MFKDQLYNKHFFDITGQFVVGVTAVDRDVGPNGRVIYRLQGGDCSRFSLDSQRGIITTANFLSGAGTRFQCTIEARDQVSDRRFTVNYKE